LRIDGGTGAARRDGALRIRAPGLFEEVFDLVSVVAALTGLGEGRTHGSIVPYVNRMKSTKAPAALGRIESSRSRKPPCPGSQVLMSLTPRSRLISDSVRSPSVPVATMVTPKITPTHQG